MIGELRANRSRGRACRLTINPGTTTTRIGLFETRGTEVKPVLEQTIEHDEAVMMTSFATIADQLDFRAAAILDFLSEVPGGVRLAAVSGRGGMLSPVPAGVIAVDANLLAKGRIDSATYLRAVVASKIGIRGGDVLSNLTPAEMPSVPRLLGATDTGILPLPTLEQKRAILANAHSSLGSNSRRPGRGDRRSEQISEAQPATVDAAAAFAADSRADALTGLIVDGPFGYDVALSPKAAAAKGLDASPVAGRAEFILFPNLEAGNATLKAWKLHGAAKTGALSSARPCLCF